MFVLTNTFQKSFFLISQNRETRQLTHFEFSNALSLQRVFKLNTNPDLRIPVPYSVIAKTAMNISRDEVMCVVLMSALPCLVSFGRLFRWMPKKKKKQSVLPDLSYVVIWKVSILPRSRGGAEEAGIDHPYLFLSPQLMLHGFFLLPLFLLFLFVTPFFYPFIVIVNSVLHFLSLYFNIMLCNL